MMMFNPNDERQCALLSTDHETLLELYNNNLISKEDFMVGISPICRTLYYASKMNNEPKKGHVYIIETQDGKVKIGRSVSPKNRIRCLETQGNLIIKNQHISDSIEKYDDLERKMHSKFKGKKITGEWFEIKFEDALEQLKIFTAK